MKALCSWRTFGEIKQKTYEIIEEQLNRRKVQEQRTKYGYNDGGTGA